MAMASFEDTIYPTRRYKLHSSSIMQGTTPIKEPSATDVLFGRGGKANHHKGNGIFRELILSKGPIYHSKKNGYKRTVARDILQRIHAKGGRFIEKHEKSGLYHEVEDQRAMDKIAQSLRETKPARKASENSTSNEARLPSAEGVESDADADDDQYTEAEQIDSIQLRDADARNLMEHRLLASHRAELEVELLLRREEQVAAVRQREMLYRGGAFDLLRLQASQYQQAQLAAALVPALAPLYLQNHEAVGPPSNLDVIFDNGIEYMGNPLFRRMIDQSTEENNNSSARNQVDLAREIVLCINRTGGRFLERYANTPHYYELEPQEAVKKTGQVLRGTMEEDEPSGAHMPNGVDSSQQALDEVVARTDMKREAAVSAVEPENQPRPRKPRGREAALISEQLGYKRLNNEYKALKLRTLDLAKRNEDQAIEIKNLKDQLGGAKTEKVDPVVDEPPTRNEEVEQLRAALKLAQAAERTLKRQNEYLMQCINAPTSPVLETTEPPLKKSRIVEADFVRSDSTAVDGLDHQSSTTNEDTLGEQDGV